MEAFKCTSVSQKEEDGPAVRADAALGKRRPGRRPANLGCQVCGVELRASKAFHQRYHICGEHMNAKVVMRGGQPHRFCQQCGRFHELACFDPAMRSCRQQLARHAERRRLLRARIVDAGTLPHGSFGADGGGDADASSGAASRLHCSQGKQGQGSCGSLPGSPDTSPSHQRRRGRSQPPAAGEAERALRPGQISSDGVAIKRQRSSSLLPGQDLPQPHPGSSWGGWQQQPQQQPQQPEHLGQGWRAGSYDSRSSGSAFSASPLLLQGSLSSRLLAGPAVAAVDQQQQQQQPSLEWFAPAGAVPPCAAAQFPAAATAAAAAAAFAAAAPPAWLAPMQPQLLLPRAAPVVQPVPPGTLLQLLSILPPSPRHQQQAQVAPHHPIPDDALASVAAVLQLAAAAAAALDQQQQRGEAQLQQAAALAQHLVGLQLLPLPAAVQQQQLLPLLAAVQQQQQQLLGQQEERVASL